MIVRFRLARPSPVSGLLVAALGLVASPTLAQRPTLSPATRAFVTIDTSVLALRHVRVIDGTGSPARDDQTVVIRDGTIAAVGPAASVRVPDGAQVLDLTGKTVIPGLVMVHEHLYYPTGPGVYGNLTESFVKLYLAGGVTSMRTGGNMNGYSELNVAKAIARGEKPGPWIDATGPYLNGPNPFGQMQSLTTPAEARAFVNFWADQGATSFKAYMNISREVLGAAIQAAHARGLKVTGHLCSVTYAEAADLGIDDLEHGFLASTDFVAGKTPDECPRGGNESLLAVEPTTPAFQALVKDLVRHHVAVTSTLTVFETFTPGRPQPPGTEVLLPELQSQFAQFRERVAQNPASPYATLFPRAMALERAFAQAGGLLLVGTDPTGGGGVIPGFSNQRAIELLVEEGFTPEQAIQIGTLNGATYLGRADRIGSIAAGKQADLVLIAGNPASDIAAIRQVETVFKQGVGYDPQKLIAAVKGRVGLF